MSTRIAEPLPECALCERPTRRDIHAENGGLCSECATGIADTVRMLPVSADVVSVEDARRRRAERQAALEETVYVERYLPPVPGQLEMGEEL